MRRPLDATPKGKTAVPTDPFRKPANYTPRRSRPVYCYARLHTSRFLIVLFQREKGLDLEAHLSTEDPPTCARAWVSFAHEDDWRSSCARRAPRAWPQAPHRRLAPRHSWTPRVCGGVRATPPGGARGCGFSQCCLPSPLAPTDPAGFAP